MLSVHRRRRALSLIQQLGAPHPPGGKVAAKLTALAQLVTYADEERELERYTQLAEDVARILN